MRVVCAMDFALRVCESAAFGTHSVLGLTNPFHGAVSSVLGDQGSLPGWFWPLAGAMLALVSYVNLMGSDEVVLCAQAYIAAFHSGGVFWHWRVKHHPVVGIAPGVWVVIAIAVTALRTDLWTAALGGLACAETGVMLGYVMVTPPSADDEALLG
mmetsp:Transcript_88665/g.248096  ORF Transcript_88665/g.248096 Transcript_88665/m.248096 type:complete len:155 (+) Transcript_88665:91-555(+)